MSKLSIVFFGTPEFATSSLVTLIENHFEIKAVVTSTDKKSGRGNKIKFSHIKSYCIDNKLRLLQPQSLQNPIFIDDLKSMEADVFVVVAYRMLPKIVWEIPRKGTINLHASILPSLRGAAPINWAIINGLKETGLTTFFINEKIDTGDIILQKKVRIDENENFGSLHQKLMIYGGGFLVSSLKLIDSNRFKSIKQDTKSKNLTAPKLDKFNTRINWEKPGKNISNLIRGLSPTPGAWTIISEHGIIIKIFSAFFVNSGPNNKIELKIENNKLVVSLKDGHLEIKEIQIQGKKRMNSKEFINGYKKYNNVELY